MTRTFRTSAFALLSLLILPWAALQAQQDPWFQTGSLNTGLSAPSDAVDRRTPRATLETFLEAAERGDWMAAAHTLNMADIAPEAQAGQAERLARQLHSVIDRKAPLDWGQLNERPDALQIIGGQQEATAGEPRRSLLLRQLDLDPVPASIRLNRVKPGEDADPVWVFARETVADIPALYRVYGPSPLESRLPSVLRQDVFWGLMWWELLALPIVVFAAIALGITVHGATRWLSRRADRPVVRRVIRAVAMPLVIATVAFFVSWLTSNLFVFSGRIDIVLTPLIAIGFVTAILLLIVNVIGALMDHLIAPDDDIDLTGANNDDARAMATKLSAAKRILVIVVALVGAGVVLSTADVFRSIGVSLLASAGALTLVLGFAARDVLGNIMSSLQIALNQSARIGDRVVYKGELCHVERIHMTYVQLKDWDGTRVVVPVKEFVSETFSNWTLQEPAMLRILKFRLAPTADVEALRQAFMDILREMSDGDFTEELGDLDEASVNVAGHNVFGIDTWFSVPCADPNTSWEVACTVRERLVIAANDIATDDRPVFPEAVAADAA